MTNASGVKDKTLRRFAAAAALGIPVKVASGLNWSELRRRLYYQHDDALIARYEAVKKNLRLKLTYEEIVEHVGSGDALKAVTEAPPRPQEPQTDEEEPETDERPAPPAQDDVAAVTGGAS